ncbi:MAG: ABC transporter substrate-binding protein [Desulfovibrio sp.]|nr:ABC transporter substrate-binding protein [Desulfovibrio sp.]
MITPFSHRSPTLQRNTCFVLCLSLFCWLCAVPAAARMPMRIICVESGPLIEYNLVLQGVAHKLYYADFLTARPPYINGNVSTRKLWHWLGEHARGNLQFLQDGFYSAQWNDLARKKVKEAVQQRLDTQHDVDAILALGTRAGQDMATLRTDIPVIVMSCSDAVGAGIVRSVVDSGKDNLVALVSPWRYRRQIEFFHSLFNFRRLGLVYEDTPTGRSVVGLKEIEAAANALGVELLRCHAVLHGNDAEKMATDVELCHKQLVEQHVDAVYVTTSVAMTKKQTQRMLTPLINAEIPTFSQSSDNVQGGALLSFVDDSVEEGRNAARLLLAIQDGVLPRALSQMFQSPRLLAVNLHTASLLGWDIPLEVLISVDEFYD